MEQINEGNYFSLNNRGLSQSKLKEYGICPNYFYRKNITGEFVREETAALKIGHEVDALLTEIEKETNSVVFTGDRRTKLGKEEYQLLIESGKTVLSQAEYDNIQAVVKAVKETSAYQEIEKTFVFQEILQIEAELGPHFDFLYGKVDAYRINPDGVCDLLDLKTCRSVNHRRYYFNAVELGYFKQLRFYAWLLEQKYPQIKGFRFYHLAVEKSEPFGVRLFQIPNEYIMKESEWVQETIKKVREDKEFKKADASFKTPTELINPVDF